MSDQPSGIRLSIDDDNDLFPAPPQPNPLMPREAQEVRKPEKPSDVFRFIGDIAAQYGQHVAQGVWDAGPGAMQKVMSGEVQPGTPEFNQLGAQSALTYGIFGAPMPRPYGSLGTFGGMGARYAPTSRLREVTEMEQGAWPRNAPASREEIFDKTGWHRGADGLWRFNISDKDAALRLENLHKNSWKSPVSGRDIDSYGIKWDFSGKKQTLGDILKHDELFKQYPELRDMEVKPTPIFDMTTKGAYNPDTNTLHLAGGEAGDFMSVLLHEVQHSIQKREGFARGGNVNEFLPPKFDERLKDNAATMKLLEREVNSYGFTMTDLKGAHGLPPFDQPLKYTSSPGIVSARNAPKDLVDRVRSAVQKQQVLDNVISQAHESYRNLAGEVESRATQAQHAQQRWDQLPEQTGDFRQGLTGGEVVPYPTGTQIVKPQ